LNKVDGAMTWLHDNKRDPNGHYGVYWGREGPQLGALGSWNLNEQSSVARAYLYTGAIPEPSSAVLLLGVGAAWTAIGRRRTRRVSLAGPAKGAGSRGVGSLF
jgi:hypothetical protein